MPTSPSPHSSLAPSRRSLATEAAELLRRAIREGRWDGRLPSERSLSSEMKISRPTLREALAMLEKDHTISRQGRRARAIGKVARTPSAASRVVRLLSPLKMVEMQQHEQIWLDLLRSLLAGKGYDLQLQVRPALFTTRARIGSEVLAEDTACWLLHRSSHHLQRQFSRQGVAAVIAGSAYEDIALSSVDVDHQAACRHAVGMLRRAGHEEIYWLGLKSRHAGDLLSEAGFSEGIGNGPPTRLARHDGTDAGVCRTLDRLLQRQPKPTAFVISNSNHALTAVGHLSQRGLIAGRNYALIARDSAPFFEHVTPSVARYSHMPEKMARELANLIFKLASGSRPGPARKRIMPDFVPGASLAELSSLK